MNFHKIWECTCEKMFFSKLDRHLKHLHEISNNCLETERNFSKISIIIKKHTDKFWSTMREESLAYLSILSPENYIQNYQLFVILLLFYYCHMKRHSKRMQAKNYKTNIKIRQAGNKNLIVLEFLMFMIYTSFVIYFDFFSHLNK